MPKYLSDTYIVIPAKNEDSYIAELLQKILALGFEKIVVVNDSSTDNTRRLAEEFDQVTVIDHIINLGPGAATQTGIKYAVEQHAKIIATIDADLQHDPNDLLKLVKKLEQDAADLVIGSRFLQENEIPGNRRIYNKIGNVISYFFTGIYLSDSQSGLKAISGRLAESMDLNYDGFEFCMEIIKHAHSKKAKILEIPVNVIYTPETLNKGQSFMSGINMISRLLSPFN